MAGEVLRGNVGWEGGLDFFRKPVSIAGEESYEDRVVLREGAGPADDE